MRLTGGADRGRKLRAPDAPVLDLYAGTGALGLEALSRGAPKVVFVERDTRALAALARNLRELGLEDKAVIVGAKVQAALARLAGSGDGTRFGWVFVDPPYASSEAQQTLEALAGGGLLAAGAVVVFEHDKRRVPPDSAGDLYLADRRFYGDTGVSFYRATGLA
jgi:16S rRNA (guanine966-N2)-methyltransferase